MTVAIVTVILLGILLGARRAHAMTAGLSRTDRCGVTPPGRLIDGGRVMDPDRLRRAVD